MSDYNVHPLEIVDLGKWPSLVVTGERISERAANEVIIRTTALEFLEVNDSEWNDLVMDAFGLSRRRDQHNQSWQEDLARLTAQEHELRTLPLQYLHNSRVSSAYIGGPHGWCNWDGTIGCAGYSIGKWPDGLTIQRDLKAITTAFPYLNMTVQVVHENDVTEDEPHASITWYVHGDEIEYDVSSRQPLVTPVELLSGPAMMNRFFSPGGERGAPIERIREAIAQVRTTHNSLKVEDDGNE